MSFNESVAMTKFMSSKTFIASNLSNFLKSIDADIVTAANEKQPERKNPQMFDLNIIKKKNKKKTETGHLYTNFHFHVLGCFASLYNVPRYV